uniref:Putative secreted protein n=1 Tax=Ixodes ricinus TaxID=34613 RepID=A0A6B0V1Q1_IXORI
MMLDRRRHCRCCRRHRSSLLGLAFLHAANAAVRLPVPTVIRPLCKPRLPAEACGHTCARRHFDACRAATRVVAACVCAGVVGAVRRVAQRHRLGREAECGALYRRRGRRRCCCGFGVKAKEEAACRVDRAEVRAGQTMHRGGGFGGATAGERGRVGEGGAEGRRLGAGGLRRPEGLWQAPHGLVGRAGEIQLQNIVFLRHDQQL